MWIATPNTHILHIVNLKNNTKSPQKALNKCAHPLQNVLLVVFDSKNVKTFSELFTKLSKI